MNSARAPDAEVFDTGFSEYLDAAPVAGSSVRVLLFGLGGRTHCAPLRDIREIVPAQHTTPLPGAPPHVRGIINLRGSIVTVLDAAACTHGSRVTSEEASILLVDYSDRPAGVLVDEVYDIGLLGLDVPDDAMLDLGELTRTALVEKGIA